MPRPWQYHYEFWQEMLGPPPAPKLEPVPEPAPEPQPTPEPPQQEPTSDPPRASAKSIRGWDWMRAQHKQLQRAHLQRR